MSTETRDMPSTGAMEHLALLLQHRPDPENIEVVIHPHACPKCHELAAWAEATAQDVAQRSVPTVESFGE